MKHINGELALLDEKEASLDEQCSEDEITQNL